MKARSLLLSVLVLFATAAVAADNDTKDKNTPNAAPPEMSIKSLDGVNIEAVENYPNTKSHELGLGIGFYPFKPYYYGFSIMGDYVYYFDKMYAWEILNAGYAFTTATNLTTQLADKYGVRPESIEKLSAVFSSNFLIAHTHGKLLFLNDFIRYFRSFILLGGGLVMTSQQSQAAASLGLRFDAFVNDSFSWKLEIRDMITFSGLENYVAITLGTGISF